MNSEEIIMSGGHWDYLNDSLKERIFSQEDDEGETHLISNPLEDQFLSDLAHDIFVLLHTYDWYVSGDIGEDTYQSRVEDFYIYWKEKFAALPVDTI
jgi:hypothetical protein